MHTPVLLQKVVKYLDPKPGDFIVDGTVDGGGHALAIIKKIGAGGFFLGMDLDRALLGRMEEKIARDAKSEIKNPRIILEEGNYADLPKILEKHDLPRADGFLLDLGFSSEQLDSGKGFSFQKDEPLIMTYAENGKPAAQILRELKENELANVIFELGGERMSRRIAKAIKAKGRERPIVTSGELAEVVRRAVPKNYERGRIDPATRTFQALRIYTNKELKSLGQALKNLPLVLKVGGRAAIISFHSLEDRLIKNYFRDYAKKRIAEIVTKKPVTANNDEIENNPRARSAKLRVIKLL